MTRSEYEAIPAVNWSTLKHLGKSPAHYLHNLTDPGEDSDARQRGRVLHLAVFEPERLTREVVVYPERRAGKEWQAFSAAHAGKEIVNSRTWDNVCAISKAARTHPMAAKYLAGGRGEQTVTWTHKSPPIADLPSWQFACKGRIDFLADCGFLVDLKSTRDASPSGFGRECMRYEHHAQLAFYRDGYEAMTGVRLPVVIVAVEAAAPHVVQVYRVGEDALELGRERYASLLAQLRVCREESRWDGYAGAEMELELPHWAMADKENDVDPELVFAAD
jgi:exodeoxyribonuclease VIII